MGEQRDCRERTEKNFVEGPKLCWLMNGMHCGRWERWIRKELCLLRDQSKRPSSLKCCCEEGGRLGKEKDWRAKWKSFDWTNGLRSGRWVVEWKERCLLRTKESCRQVCFGLFFIAYWLSVFSFLLRRSSDFLFNFLFFVRFSLHSRDLVLFLLVVSLLSVRELRSMRSSFIDVCDWGAFHWCIGALLTFSLSFPFSSAESLALSVCILLFQWRNCNWWCSISSMCAFGSLWCWSNHFLHSSWWRVPAVFVSNNTEYWFTFHRLPCHYWTRSHTNRIWNQSES